MAEQNRRSFLEWLTYGLGALFGIVLGAPAIAYLIDPLNRKAAASDLKTVAHLDDLQVGIPKEVVIRETRRDAWNLYPNEIVGRVFLIREQNNEVKAFTTICPHLGCSINYTGSTTVPFVCPCHGGRFEIDGKRINPDHNPAPRGMDPLETKILQPSGLVQVKYQKFGQG